MSYSTSPCRHIKEAHSRETFQCKICLSADPTCFPYAETIKELTSHMVLKHGDMVDSYYQHMLYPTTLYGSLCSGKDCETTGKVVAFDAVAIGVRALLWNIYVLLPVLPIDGYMLMPAECRWGLAPSLLPLFFPLLRPSLLPPFSLSPPSLPPPSLLSFSLLLNPPRNT